MVNTAAPNYELSGAERRRTPPLCFFLTADQMLVRHEFTLICCKVEEVEEVQEEVNIFELPRSTLTGRD